MISGHILEDHDRWPLPRIFKDWWLVSTQLEKYAQVKLDHFPGVSGENKKCLSCHRSLDLTVVSLWTDVQSSRSLDWTTKLSLEKRWFERPFITPTTTLITHSRNPFLHFLSSFATLHHSHTQSRHCYFVKVSTYNISHTFHVTHLAKPRNKITYAKIAFFSARQSFGSLFRMHHWGHYLTHCWSQWSSWAMEAKLQDPVNQRGNRLKL